MQVYFIIFLKTKSEETHKKNYKYISIQKPKK